MAAPKNPSTSAANAARRAQGDRTASNRLTDAGFLVVEPEMLKQMPRVLQIHLKVWLAENDRRVPAVFDVR